MLFSMELVSLLEAGLNLVEALQTLAEKEARGERQEVLVRPSSPRSTAASRSRRRWPRCRSISRRSTSRPSRRRSAPATCARRSAATSPTRKRSTACARRSSPASIYPAILMCVGGLVLGVPHVLRRAALRPGVRGHGRHAAVLLQAAARLRQLRRQQRHRPRRGVRRPDRRRGCTAVSRPEVRAWLNASCGACRRSASA